MSIDAGPQSTPKERKLANFLGWFSLALGAPQLTRPDLVNRMIGVRDDPASRRWQRIVGVREIAAWTGILSRRRPVGWLWARVAGDIKDLALLGVAFRSKREDTTRLTAATASVVGVTALDVYTAVRMSRGADASPEEEKPMEVRAAITVKEPLTEVFAGWQNFENFPLFMQHVEAVQDLGDRRSHWTAKGPAGWTMEWDAEVVTRVTNEVIEWRSVGSSDLQHSGSVRFKPAPAEQGTEIHLYMEYDAPGGKLGELLAKLLGEDPQQEVKDDLRRFKQVMEVGEIVRSEATPEGTGARRFTRQRPARPLEEQPEPVGAGGRKS